MTPSAPRLAAAHLAGMSAFCFNFLVRISPSILAWLRSDLPASQMRLERLLDPALWFMLAGWVDMVLPTIT